MNEVSSFCDGHCVVELNEGNSEFECNCLEMNFDEENFIEYQIGEGGRTGMNVDSSTISLSSIHYNNVTEYNLHNLHSYLQCKSTYSSLQHLYNKRPFILSRSTFSGSGKYNAHWLGDNSATWWDLKYSISGMINMNLFSVPFVGADICGFNGNTNALLCLRWYQLGIFFLLPFSFSLSFLLSPFLFFSFSFQYSITPYVYILLSYSITPYVYILLSYSITPIYIAEYL